MHMAKNGLEATTYRGWIDANIEIDEDLKILMSEYVIGTPAYGLSKKERGLYNYYRYDNLSDYILLQKDLLEGIAFNYFETYEKLKDALLLDDDINFSSKLPEQLIETIYIYIGDTYNSKFYKAYFKSEDSQKGKKKSEISEVSEQKKVAVAIDKLFYHMRNSLAHGCFALVQQDKRFIVLQDETEDPFVSARIVLSVDRVKKWIKYLVERRKKLEEENNGQEQH